MTEKKKPQRNLFDVFAGWLGDDSEEDKRRSGRGRLAQAFAVLGAVFAGLQLVYRTLDLANRTLETALTWFPYVVPALFIGGGLAAVYFFKTASTAPQRNRAIGALVLVVVAGAGWGGWSVYQHGRLPKAVIIAIADFEGEQATKGVDWGRRIYDRVKEQVDQLDLVERVDVLRVYKSFSESDEAREHGEKLKATVVLWGWCDDVGVSPHFELLRTAKEFETALAAPPRDLTDFDVYIESGPQEMAYIVSVVLGLVQYADGNYQAAADLFTRALAAAPDTSTLLGTEVALFYRANSRFFSTSRALRPMDSIVSDLEEAVSSKPDFWQAHWNLALVYTDYCSAAQSAGPQLALDDALVEAQRVQELQPLSSEAYWLLAIVHSERGEWLDAEAAFRQTVRLDPSHADAQEGLAKALEEQGRTVEAQAAYEQALTTRTAELDQEPDANGTDHPTSLSASQDQLGYAYLNTGQYELAVASFRSAIELQPDNADFHRHLGNAIYWQDKTEASVASTQLDQAIGAYETARSLDPEDGLLLTVLGGAYSEVGRLQEAAAAYEAAVRVAPCDDEALLLLAGLYYDLGRESEARVAYERLAELNPRQVVGWLWLATDAYLSEDYAAAANYYRAGLEADPTSSDLAYGLGSALYYLEDYAGAEEAYRQANQMAPGDPATLAAWGDTLARLGRVDEAISAYEGAAEVGPDYLTWISLGLLYEQSGRLVEAAEAYGTAAAELPEDSLAHGARGAVLQHLGRHDEAVESYEIAVRYSPDNASYWESLALSYSVLEQADDALRAAEKALEYNQDSALAHLIRGGVLELQGDVDGAREDYERTLELAGDNEIVRQWAEDGLERLEG